MNHPDLNDCMFALFLYKPHVGTRTQFIRYPRTIYLYDNTHANEKIDRILFYMLFYFFLHYLQLQFTTIVDTSSTPAIVLPSVHTNRKISLSDPWPVQCRLKSPTSLILFPSKMPVIDMNWWRFDGTKSVLHDGWGLSDQQICGFQLCEKDAFMGYFFPEYVLELLHSIVSAQKEIDTWVKYTM